VKSIKYITFVDKHKSEVNIAVLLYFKDPLDTGMTSKAHSSTLNYCRRYGQVEPYLHRFILIIIPYFVTIALQQTLADAPVD
jgi:hypothetical protein